LTGEEARHGAGIQALPDISAADEWYRKIVFVRRFEEQAERGFRRGKIGGYLHLYTGQEAVAMGCLAALRGDDIVFTGYRDHAHALMRDVPAGAVMAELYGKATGVCKGKGGSMHLVDVSRGLYGGYGIVAGHIPLAVGAAFALRYLGTDRVCMCFLGDGAMNNGAFHEPANLAGLWGHQGWCPVVFIVENNQYGMGTAVARASAVPRLAERFGAYDIPHERCDGMDVFTVYEAAMRAVAAARRDGRPYALEAATYRFAAHGAADLTQPYREKVEVEQWRKRDPLLLLEQRLRAAGALDDGRVAEIARAADEAVQEAVSFAETSPDPSPDELFTDVVSAGTGVHASTPAAASTDVTARDNNRAAGASTAPSGNEITYREAIRATLTREMDGDNRILLLGEDIGIYQGTFRITEGLLERYGPRRVIDTPISELGFIGAAIGMGLLGLRPIVEVMTWNFALGAVDQIVQNAAKARYFSGGQLRVPLVIRGPNGAGVQLSAQHSQSFESFYGHFPGLTVVAPATPADAAGLLRAAIRGEDPVIFLEHAALYGTKGRVPPGEEALPPGCAACVRPGRDVTIVAYSRMLHLALRAAEVLAGEGIECEVIDLRSLRPLDTDTVTASVRRTHRAVVVQEQWPLYGTAAEVASRICERDFDYLDAPVERVTGADVPAPYARPLEQLALPTEAAVADAVRRAVS
jgi:2-oxoisovalerate dehydrogenase E1 component